MEEKKPFFVFLTLHDLFNDFLVRNSKGELDFKLGECFLLVVSRDIVTSVGMKTREFMNTSEYQSRYDNVEFLTTLLPGPQLMEYERSNGVDYFAEQYVNQIQAKKPMSDIISICDCVVNRGIPVIIIVSSADMMTAFPTILRDYIRDEFGLIGYTIDDLNAKSADIIYDIGNVEEIKKSVAEHMDMYLKQHDSEYFFNTLTDDMEKAYRDMLSSHTEDELRALAKERSVFVSRRFGKEEIINAIIEDIIAEGE